MNEAIYRSDLVICLVNQSVLTLIHLGEELVNSVYCLLSGFISMDKSLVYQLSIELSPVKSSLYLVKV